MYLAQEEYTFTFDSGNFFNLTSETAILTGLKKYLAPYGEILSVSRPLLSNRYIVVIIPKLAGSLPVWEGIMADAWKSTGFDSITMIQAEGGSRSTQPGGLPQIGQQAGEAVGMTVKGIVSPLVPYLLIGLAGYLGILFMQRRRD